MLGFSLADEHGHEVDVRSVERPVMALAAAHEVVGQLVQDDRLGPRPTGQVDPTTAAPGPRRPSTIADLKAPLLNPADTVTELAVLLAQAKPRLRADDLASELAGGLEAASVDQVAEALPEGLALAIVALLPAVVPVGDVVRLALLGVLCHLRVFQSSGDHSLTNTLSASRAGGWSVFQLSCLSALRETFSLPI